MATEFMKLARGEIKDGFNFGDGAFEIFDRESVNGNSGDACVEAPAQSFEEFVTTDGMALMGREVVTLGPASVAVHYEGDVGGGGCDVTERLKT